MNALGAVNAETNETMNSKRNNAFTLIELLVVISLISMLMAVLVPALSRARQRAKALVCASRLRQMSMAANAYIAANNGYYPPAYQYRFSDGRGIMVNWDYTTEGEDVSPGLLWQSGTNAEIKQCPSFKGNSNTPAERFTGYNYNTSYIGRGEYEKIKTPAKSEQIRRPDRCAVFGDGEYALGANKFMRSPLPSEFDSSFSGRYAGTQGFRHNDSTNIAWADGHCSSLKAVFAENSLAAEADKANIAEGTGFISAGNEFYSLN